MLYSTEEVQKDPWKNKPLRYSGISPKDPQENRNQPKILRSHNFSDCQAVNEQPGNTPGKENIPGMKVLTI